MKANAPEKLYLILHNGLVCYCRNNEDDIEYTRTDAFIEKACDWLETHINDYLVKGRDIDYMFDDFRKAMETSLGTNGIKKI